MTATTKEQREDLHSLTAIDWILDCPGDPIPNTVASDALRHLPALLSDSKRLAAIEAVTGEEVRELVDRCQEHLTMSKFLRKEHLLARANDDRELSSPSPPR